MAKFSFGGKSYDPRPVKAPKPAKPLASKPIWGGLGQQWGAGSSPGTTSELPSTAKPATPYVAPGPDETWKDQPYFDTTAGITKGLENLKGYLVASQKSSGLDYGVDYDTDSTDPLKASNFRIADNVDITNPNSRAALLKRAYQQSRAGNRNSMAARGQLYSGALQNAQDQTDTANNQATDSLIKDFSGKFGGAYQTWLDANTTATGQRTDAAIAAIGRNANNPTAGTPTNPTLAGDKSGSTTKPVAGFENIPYDQVAARGLTIGTGPGGFVIKDSKGRVIPGASVHVIGTKRFIRVPE